MNLVNSKSIIATAAIACMAWLGSYAQDTVWVRKNAPLPLETYAVAFSADGNKVFSGSECHPSYLRIFQAATGAQLWEYTLTGSLMCVQGLKFSSDGTRAVVLEELGNLLIFDYSGATPVLLHTLSLGVTGAFSLAFSPDGSKIAIGCTQDRLKICDVATGTVTKEVVAHTGWVMGVDWHSSDYIATCGADRLVKLWDTAGNLLKTYTGHTNNVQSVRFSPDGQYLVTGARDKTIKVWDRAAGTLVRTLNGHNGWVSQVVVTPDGTKIVSGSRDSTMGVWDLVTGNRLKSFGYKASGNIYTVDVSPSGNYVAAGTSMGEVQLWDLDKTTGVKPIIAADPYLQLNPNPATAYAEVDYGKTGVVAQVIATGADGRQYALPAAKKQGAASIDLSLLPSGSYQVYVNAQKGNFISKIVKL